ncbi:MAG: cupin domain-containing protein [Bacteroidales bacterium]|nr:cupin domain-containing protein [Bacteroidales bacterium]
MKNVYPDIITGLPEADIPFKGIKGWLSQDENHQIVFLEIEPIGEVAEHKHGAQWGIVADGEMDLTIGGVTKTYKKGDSYFIPEGILHSAVFKTKTFAIDFFNEKSRYQKKK